MMKAVFFDINDTLINHSEAQEITIKKMSSLLPEQYRAEFIKIWKMTAKKYWDLFEKEAISFEEQRLKRIKSTWNHFKIKLTPKQIKQYADYYTTYYEQALNINPILKIFLPLLKTNKVTAGIISNGYGPLQRNRLKAVGLDSFFPDQLIFISEEIGIAKPDEKIFILAEKTAGVSASDVIFFGDNLKNDIEPAKKRGWKTVLIKPNDKTTSFAELEGLFTG